MAVVKGFTLQVVDADGVTVVANLGTCTFPALQWLQNMSNRSISIDTETNAYFAPYTPDYGMIGNSLSDYYSMGPVSSTDLTIPFARFYELAPMTLRKESIQYAGYKLKLTGNNSGYYAVSQSTITTQGYITGSWNLFDNEDNQIGTASSSVGFPLSDSVRLRCYMPHSIHDGIVTSTSASVLTIGFFNATTHNATCSIAQTTVTNEFVEWFNSLTQQKEPTDDPYSEIDGEGEMGGGGVVGIPGFPGLTATSTGIIGLFAPTAGQMQALADYMWTDFGGTATTTLEVLSEIVDALKRSISNPLDYVVGLNIIPSQGLSIGGSSVIRFGFTSSGVSMPRLSNQYFAVDCGSLYFDTLCGNTFLDYAPYSKFSIYLPYIGVKEVDANDFVGHTIGVIYHGDVVTGGVTAYITKDGSVMYQYSGSCAISIPLTADGWGSTISGAVQIATSLVAGAASGGAAGVGLAAAKGAASVAANPSMLSPQVSRSGAVSGSAGCMGVQYPYVIREAVRFHSTDGFNKSSGYPSFYYRELSDVYGYTVCLNVHLENIPGTQNEVAEIERLLKEGVIL